MLKKTFALLDKREKLCDERDMTVEMLEGVLLKYTAHYSKFTVT